MLNAKLQSPAKRHQVSAFSLQPSAFARSGFTLIELLVVISILGILAALSVPAIRSLGKSNVNVSATAQLLGDVGYARQLAIANHTTVYMVFLPTNFWNNPIYNSALAYNTWWSGPPAPGLTTAQRTDATNLSDKQLTGYTFIAKGAVGDQPGNHQWHYLTPWRSLPEGTFIPPWKFSLPNPYPLLPVRVINDPISSQTYSVYSFTNVLAPFPTADAAASLALPCIAFNYLGQLTFDGQNLAGRHEYIPLAHGAVLPAVDANKALVLNPPPGAQRPPDVSESPPGNSTNSSFNLVDIDPLTGRATLRFEKVQ